MRRQVPRRLHLGGKPGADSVRAVEQALEAEQCVIVFPAGEVSRLGPRGVRDTRWRRGFLRFARATGAPVLPVRVVARNSAFFYGASALFKPAGTALLAREMFRRSQRRLQLHVGQPLRLDPAIAPAPLIRQVREALYALGRREPRRVEPPAEVPSPLPLAKTVPKSVGEAVMPTRPRPSPLGAVLAGSAAAAAAGAAAGLGAAAAVAGFFAFFTGAV